MSPTPEGTARAKKAWETIRTRKAEAEKAKKAASQILEAADAVETTFGLERDLQGALRRNITQLQSGLEIADGGKETTVASGRIDILAIDNEKARVVVELKAGTADRDAIGQILSYMGDLQTENKGSVRGILVAGDFTKRAIAAARAIPTVQLRKYSFSFSFVSVD